MGRQAAPPACPARSHPAHHTQDPSACLSLTGSHHDDSFLLGAGAQSFSPRPAGRAEEPTDGRAHRAGRRMPRAARARAPHHKPSGRSHPRRLGLTRSRPGLGGREILGEGPSPPAHQAA